MAALGCWQCLAVRGLGDEALNVCRELTDGSLRGARAAVGRIVGRDTDSLSAAGVARAAVETVAENFSDGVAAPMLWMMVGGAPFGLCYKAINTMDSMVGYKNSRYLYFGRAAARLDDAANWIPARLSALQLILAAAVEEKTGKQAFRIWKRDRRLHASPNSAQPEAAMAGALGVELAGPASYFGTVRDKPAIGDPTRAIEARDIGRAVRLMRLASWLCVAFLGAVRGAFLCL